MTEICFIEAKPRIVATGAETTIRLAGGGTEAAYYRGGEHYRAGIVEMPRFRSAFGFDDNGWTGGTTPTNGQLGFLPGDTSLIATLAALYWRDAAITVDTGDEAGVIGRRLTGSVADIASNDGQIALTLVDPSKVLDKPLLGTGFAGTGGIEGPSEATGRAKRRSWGRVFNIELELLDKVNNIYEAGDPSKPLQAFDAVRDKGRAGSIVVLAWQGSIAATFAALQAAAAPQGGCVAAPSIACVKWWTEPAGPLTADIRGETAGGYTEVAAAIASRMLTAVGGPVIWNQAAAEVLRSAVSGVHIASGTDTVAQALDRLFLGLSLYWVLEPAGSIRVGEWAWKAPSASFQAQYISRERQLPPVKSRKVGYRRNHRVHQTSEISAAVLLADDVTYLDGTSIEALKPAQAGANVTGTNTAAAIAGQGALATQNNVDWRLQVANRPAIGELYYDFNYADLAALRGAGWVLSPNNDAHYAMAVTPNSPGGRTLVMGTGTGGGGISTNVNIFGPEWVPYNANDLYEIAFDLEVISGDPTAVFYLGVEAQDRNGNNLGASYNYVATSGQGQLSLAGQRFIKKGYFTGFTSASSSGQALDPLSPAGLPDGSVAGFGAGGAVRFRPMALVNYPNTKGQVKVHAIRVTRIPSRLATQDEVAFGTVLLKEAAGGAQATLTNFKTILGTASAISGQGYLATQNFADWKTRITGAGKPSNNAGSARILSAIGPYTTVTGNSCFKSAGTHGAYDSGCVGVAQKDTAFISSGCTYDGSNAGGWVTTLCLDQTNAGGVAGGSTAGNFVATYTAGNPNGSLQIQRHNGSGYTTLATFAVPGLTFSTRRMALINNGRRAFVMIDGIVYGGDTAAYAVPAGATYFPKVLNYHRDDFAAGSVDGIVDIQYGEWTDVRTFLDDGLTVLAQAGFKTDEGTASGIVGQGPGATATADDVLNYRNVNATTIMAYVGGGQYSYDNTAGGQLRIQLPNGFSNTMIMFTVDIFDYVAGAKATFIIAGYTYVGGWTNCSAQFIGPETKSKRVRFADDGAKCVIAIGETTDTWQYPKVIIRDVMVGYANQSLAAWKAGWAISIGSPGALNIGPVIDKPRAGDAVFGEGIFESAAGATASLSNFKTLLGTAAAIAGQGALATRNNVDLSTTDVLPRGSIPPSLPNNGFTYTANTNSATVSWPSMTVYRADGTTIAISSGSQAITGLSSGTQYRIYPYVVDNGGSSATMAFVTGESGSAGSPAVLYPAAGSVTAASKMYLYGRVPLGQFNLNTTTSGSGGGGGGGWNCLHEDMFLRDGRAGATLEGDLVDTPEGDARVEQIVRARCSRWFELYSGGDLLAKVTARHLFYRAADRSEVAAEDIRLGDILIADGCNIEVTGLRLCTDEAWAIGIGIAEPHLHFAGRFDLLCHNGTAKP